MKGVNKFLLVVALLFATERANAFQQGVPANKPSGRAAATASQRNYVVLDFSLHSFRGNSPSGSPDSKTQRSLSSIPVELPRYRIFDRWRGSLGTPSLEILSTPSQRSLSMESTPIAPLKKPEVVVKSKAKETGTTSGISRMDVALFATYFANMFVVNLSVVTVPALAAANFANPAASAAFESGVASMAPMGGAIGKVINGFVCQRIGGRRASWMYLVALGVLSCGMSFTQSVGSVGTILMFYEFLSSIQWTSMCLVLDEAHKGNPKSIGRGVAILSLSSYMGALSAKTVGAAMLNMSGCWRSVTRIGATVALVGAMAMYFGISPSKRKEKSTDEIASFATISPTKSSNPAGVLKSILTNKLFWMIGIGHSLGYVIRGSDRLMVPFLHQATGFPRHICASLTAFVTLGLVLGLGKGAAFSAMESIPEKMKMLKRNYIRAIVSFFGLALCALNVTNGWIQAPFFMAAAISALSCFAASSISFQFSQVPNLVATNMFAENKAVALSLVDAGGFFFTSQIFAANTKVLGTFGWSASWSFLAIFLAGGASLMMKYMQPVLVRERQRATPAAT